MKVRWLVASLISVLLTSPAYAQAQSAPWRDGRAPEATRVQRQLRRDGPPAAAQNRQPIDQAVDQFYMNQLRQRLQLTDEQFGQITPHVRLALRERREIVLRRARLLNRLRLAFENRATEEELVQQIEGIDQVNAETQASQQRFLKSVDPLLSVEQRARLRVFEDWIDLQIRNMIARARAGQQLRQQNTAPDQD